MYNVSFCFFKRRIKGTKKVSGSKGITGIIGICCACAFFHFAATVTLPMAFSFFNLNSYSLYKYLSLRY